MDFFWLDECVESQNVKIGDKTIKYYNSFSLSNVKYSVGDCVYLHNDLTLGKKITKGTLKSAFIVRIIDLYSEKSSTKEKFKAHVQWFWKSDEIIEKDPSLYFKINPKDVFLDISFSFDSEIEVTSIICKCPINFILSSNNESKDFSMSKSNDINVKYAFDCSNLIKLSEDHIVANKYSSENDKLLDSLIDQDIDEKNHKEFQSPSKKDAQFFKTPLKEYLTPRRSLITRRINSLNFNSNSPRSPKRSPRIPREPLSEIMPYVTNESNQALNSSLSDDTVTDEEDSTSFITTRSSRSSCIDISKNLLSTPEKSPKIKLKSFTPRSSKARSVTKKFTARRSIQNLIDDDKSKSDKPSSPSNILCCREKEFTSIYQTIYSQILSKSGSCLYISGVPGTGKTATVNSVLEKLSHDVSTQFDLLKINAMCLAGPKELYINLGEKIQGFRMSHAESLKFLHSIFSDLKYCEKMPRPLVLVIDEVDSLCTKKKDVFYNLFDWATKPNSKLIVVTLSNTFDLPERIMSNKIVSRIGLNRINFSPYTFKQLEEIVQLHMKKIDICFNSDALQLICRKIAAGSGDARRVLEITSLTCNNVKSENKLIKTITMQNVQETFNKIFTSDHVELIKIMSIKEKLFLRFIATEYDRITSLNSNETQNIKLSIDDLQTNFLLQSKISDDIIIEESEQQHFLDLFSSIGLIELFKEANGCVLETYVTLICSSSDIIYASST